MKRSLVLAFFLLLFAIPALAQTPTPFTQAELERFLADYPAVTQFLEAQGQEGGALEPGFIQDARQTKAFTDFLSQRGWDVQRFFYVTQQVGSGVVALQLSEQGSRIQREYEQTKAEILKSPDLTPAQKQQFLAQMEEAMAQSRAMGDASRLAPGEMALIKANKARIFKTLGAE